MKSHEYTHRTSTVAIYPDLADCGLPLPATFEVTSALPRWLKGLWDRSGFTHQDAKQTTNRLPVSL